MFPRPLESPQFSSGNRSGIWSYHRTQENISSAGEENEEEGVRIPHLIQVVWVQELMSFPEVQHQKRWHCRYIMVSQWGPEIVAVAQDRHQTRSLGHLHCEVYQINRDFFFFKSCAKNVWASPPGKEWVWAMLYCRLGYLMASATFFKHRILLNMFVESPQRTFQGWYVHPNVWTGISLKVLCRKCRQSTGTLKLKTIQY